MGYAGVPTRGPRTAGSSSKVRRPPPRSLVLVVVVLVVAMVLMATLSLRSFVNAPGESTSHLKDGVLVIDGDEVWDGRTGTMERPVRVKDEVRLTIRDCDLEVSLERFLVDGESWFSGDPGSSIVLERTKVTVVADPAFNETLFLSFSTNYGYPNQPSMALLWRAVDLRGTLDPVLTLDVNPMNRTGDLLVTVQPSPGRDMELLETLTFKEGGPKGWQNLSVDLSRYAGEIVGLALGTTDGSMAGALFKQVRITDDGEDPPGDSFPTGNPSRDGWYTRGIGSLKYQMLGGDLHDLFSIQGSLVLSDTILTAPELPLGDGSSIGQASKIRLDEHMRGYNVRSLPRGCDVELWYGGLVMSNSTLHNVCLIGTSSDVRVEGSHFVADREQVTLFHCWGSLSDSIFRHVNGTGDPFDSGYYPTEPDLWSVSVWGMPESHWNPPVSDSVSITRCQFQDSVMGLDLSHSKVSLVECSFINISWIALWDHDTLGLGTWEGIEAINEFRDCRNTLYFETHDMEITYYHAHKSFEQWDDYVSTNGDVRDIDGDNLPTDMLLWTQSATADMYMPTTIVNVTNGVIRPKWIEVFLRVEWAGRALERLPTDATEQIVDFTNRNHDGIPLSEADVVFPEIWTDILGPNGVGNIEFDFYVYTYYGSSTYVPARVGDLRVEWRMDDELLRTLDLADGNYNWYNVTFDLPSGLHIFNYTLTGAWNATGERVYLDGWNLSIARVCENTSTDDLDGWLEMYLPVLVLDPGTNRTVQMDIAPPLEMTTYWWYWRFFIGEGSVLTVQDNSPDGVGGITMDVQGLGELVLQDFNLERLGLDFVGGSARILNLTTGRFDLDTWWTNVSIVDSSAAPYYWRLDRSNVKIERCQLDCFQMDDVEGIALNLTLVECQLNASGRILDTELGNGALRLIDSTIKDMGLRVDIGDSIYGDLEVRGCDIRGDGAIINLTNDDPYWPGYSSEGNISHVDVSGNTLIGPDSGISAEAWLFGDSILDNTIMEGARYLLWYNSTPRLETGNDSISLDLSLPEDQERSLPAEVDFIKMGWGSKVLVSVETRDPDRLPEAPVLNLTLMHWADIYWFFELDMSKGSPLVTVPDWGDHTVQFIDLVRGNPNVSFWDD